jgi:Zn-dependent peptidase ImmA (M78 family)/DNA-binding XRE family transcriptional regulator
MNQNVMVTLDWARVGGQLQQARKQSGLTQAEAAKLLGVARTTLTAVESGQRPLQASELLKLAQAYGRNLSDFVRGRPVVEPFAPQFRAAPNTDNASATAAISATVNHLEELSTNYYELEQISQQPLRYNYPPIYQYGRLSTEQAAEALAISERNRLGLGDGPIPSLRDVLEQAVGLRIFYLPFQDAHYAAIYAYDPLLGGCIALNQNHPKERSRNSLAHEYAHFLAHRHTPELAYEGQYQRLPERERFANSFAAYFLMPTSSVQARFNALYQAQGRFTAADLVKLAYDYGVSVEAMAHRLAEMRLTPPIWEALQRRGFKVRETQAQLGLDVANLPESQQKLSARYEALAIQAYHAEKLTLGDLAYFLQLDLLAVRELLADTPWQAAAQQVSYEDVMLLV